MTDNTLPKVLNPVGSQEKNGPKTKPKPPAIPPLNLSQVMNFEIAKQAKLRQEESKQSKATISGDSCGIKPWSGGRNQTYLRLPYNIIECSEKLTLVSPFAPSSYKSTFDSSLQSGKKLICELNSLLGLGAHEHRGKLGLWEISEIKPLSQLTLVWSQSWNSQTYPILELFYKIMQKELGCQVIFLHATSREESCNYVICGDSPSSTSHNKDNLELYLKKHNYNAMPVCYVFKDAKEGQGVEIIGLKKICEILTFDVRVKIVNNFKSQLQSLLESYKKNSEVSPSHYPRFTLYDADLDDMVKQRGSQLQMLQDIINNIKTADGSSLKNNAVGRGIAPIG